MRPIQDIKLRMIFPYLQAVWEGGRGRMGEGRIKIKGWNEDKHDGVTVDRTRKKYGQDGVNIDKTD